VYYSPNWFHGATWTNRVDWMRFVQKRSRVGGNWSNSCPTINVGMALHHTAFPGTISLRPSTMIQLIRDYVTCLTRAGFTHFFFINGHGGNIATLKAAFADIPHLIDLNIPNAHLVQCQVGNWFMCGSVYKPASYTAIREAHATPSEVAVTQYVYPESIKQAPLSPKVASGQNLRTS